MLVLISGSPVWPRCPLGDVIEKPAALRCRARALARAQRAPARNRKGSNNREKAATRSQSYTAGFGELDWTAPQIVSATDPRSPSGVCRTPRGIRAGPHRDLAQSVHDAGWVTLVGVGGRAEGCDRQAVRVGCWFPSSQLYSHCGLGQVRNRYGSGMDQRWVRGHARPTHDRVTNAAAGPAHCPAGKPDAG